MTNFRLSINDTLYLQERKVTLFKSFQDKFILLEREGKMDLQSKFSVGDVVTAFGKRWKTNIVVNYPSIIEFVKINNE